MNHDTKPLHDLVNQYASDIGLSPLSLDDAGRCSLLFDDKFSVTLECHQESGALVIFADLGTVAADRELDIYRKLLEGNHFWRHTAGVGTLALAPQENPEIPRTATLLYQTPLQSLDSGTFQNRLSDFVNTAEAWIDYLSNFEEHAESEEVPSPEAWLGGSMLRV